MKPRSLKRKREKELKEKEVVLDPATLAARQQIATTFVLPKVDIFPSSTADDDEALDEQPPMASQSGQQEHITSERLRELWRNSYTYQEYRDTLMLIFDPTNLQEVSLRNKLKQEDIPILAKFLRDHPTITTLHLDESIAEGCNINELLAVPTLQKLVLNHIKLNPEMHDFSQSTIHTVEFRFGAMTLGLLKNLRQSNISQLIIDSELYVTPDVPWLKEILAIPSLKELRLRHVKFDRAGLEQLKQSSVKLRITNEFILIGGIRFSDLLSLPNLIQIRASIADFQQVATAEFTENQSLESITLTELTEEKGHLRTFAALLKTLSLKNLTLSGKVLTKQITDLLLQSFITQLSLSETDFSGDFFENLARLLRQHNSLSVLSILDPQNLNWQAFVRLWNECAIGTLQVDLGDTDLTAGLAVLLARTRGLTHLEFRQDLECGDIEQAFAPLEQSLSLQHVRATDTEDDLIDAVADQSDQLVERNRQLAQIAEMLKIIKLLEKFPRELLPIIYAYCGSILPYATALDPIVRDLPLLTAPQLKPAELGLQQEEQKQVLQIKGMSNLQHFTKFCLFGFKVNLCETKNKEDIRAAYENSRKVFNEMFEKSRVPKDAIQGQKFIEWLEGNMQRMAQNRLAFLSQKSPPTEEGPTTLSGPAAKKPRHE